MNHSRWVFIGVDLGQRRDFSAIAVVEREWEQFNARGFITQGVEGRWWFRIRMLERLRLGTSYIDVVERIKEIASMPIIVDGRTVIVDGTGVGPPVVDLLRRAGLGCQIVPLLITGAEKPSTGLSGGYESVPRAQLLTSLQVLIQQDRLRVAARCKHAETLRREMLALKLNGSSNTSEVHDDLAFAVALAVWKARSGAY